MRILFISTWPSGSGLSAATVHPHLEVLAADERVEVVHYISMEQSDAVQFASIEGVVHEPVHDRESPGIVGKALNHRRRVAGVKAIAERQRPDLVICRGAPAGAFGLSLHKQFGIPFCVESFEPHAERMVDAEIWRRNGLKYRIQKRWEKLSKQNATALVTVSDRYASYLAEEEHIEGRKLYSVPCWVDTNQFNFDEDERAKLRKQLNLDDRLVCIYVGKFGGLYYDDEAFAALGVISETVGRKWHLIVLTPDDKRVIKRQLQRAGIAARQADITEVAHDEVFRFLCAADFAVSFPKSTKWSFSCSPIKHAEYWACGLPVMIPENIGDESEWIETEQLGATMNVGDPDTVRIATQSVLSVLSESGLRSRIRNSAERLRGKTQLLEAYDSLLSKYE